MSVELRQPRGRRPALRKGRPVCFTVDYDAESLLRAMVPNSQGLGLFLSELIRKEARERVGRAKLLLELSVMSEMSEASGTTEVG